MATDDKQGDVDGEGEVPLSAELIGADMPCLRCGYNLRGLKPEGQCPECGARIEKTVAFVMARAMCPVCMGPNHPSASICVHCKSPISGAAAAANYWKMTAVSAGPHREYEDDEPEAPSAAWPSLCGAFAIFLLYLGVRFWVEPFLHGPRTAEASVLALVVAVLLGAVLLFLSGLLIVFPMRQYLRTKRVFEGKYGAWRERENIKALEGREEEAEEGEPEEEEPEEEGEEEVSGGV